MTFIEAIKTCLFDKYATFKGRATRSEFWLFFLFTYIIGFIYGLVCGLFAMKIYPGLHIITLTFIIPSISCAIRRLHDIDKNGWYCLISLVPFVGSIVLLIWLSTKTHAEENQYGPVPENK